jgi:ribosomal protein S18 acetylase RimI-like enzyme
MLALIQTTRPPEGQADYPSADNLFEMMQSAAVRADTRLWMEGASLAGFALVDEFNNLLFDAAPKALRVLGEEIMHWGRECALRSGRRTLDSLCRPRDAARLAFLEGHGFRRSGEETILMQRDLRTPIPEAELPEGFAIRAAGGEAEAEALAELHRLAFGTEHMTTENRLAMMRVPAYDPSLDLVAVAPEGALAAYCMCSLEEGNGEMSGHRVGWTDPVGTHPAYQRLGLARALLCTGLRLLRDRGAEYAKLGTSSTNMAMQKAAESAGFMVKEITKIWFEKELNDSADL